MIKIAKLICKSAYIKSLEHVFNTLEYAGNKIDRQEAVFKDGTILEQDGCTKLQLSLEQEQNLKSVRLYYKDGGSKEIDWSTYSKLVSNKEEKITVAKLETVEDEIPGEFELELSQTEHKGFHDLKDLDVDKYLGYIANRDGAVKEDGHGLFGINGNISMEDARAMAEDYQDSIIWTHIISIRGDDGDKTGFNNRNAWRDLVLAKAPNLAKIYNISLENLVVNAAYHQNTDNDHVHIIMYSKDKRDGFVKGGKDGMKRATEKMKSLFLNDIFKGDVAPLKELITQQRTDIKDELKNHLVSISKSDITDGMMVNMFLSLSQDLSQHKGKCDYGYLKPELKATVNDFLRYTLDSNENLSALFTELMGSKRAYIAMYNQDESKIEKLVEEAKEKIFHPDKGQATLQNIIVHAIADYNNEKAIPLEKSSGRDNKTQDTPSHQNDVAVGLTDGATKGKNSAYAEDTNDASYSEETGDSIFFDVPPPPADKPEILPTMDEFRSLGNIKESYSLEPLPPGTKALDDWYNFSEVRERIAKTLGQNKVSETTATLFEDELELSDDELDFLAYDGSTPRLYDEELEWSENADDYITVKIPLSDYEFVDNMEDEIKIFSAELEYTENVVMDEISPQARKKEAIACVSTATKGKKSNSTKPKNSEMSPSYELSKMIYKGISKSAYQTCSTLFNPKVPNTTLQNELLVQLQEMHHLSADDKKNSKEYKDCAVKSFQIMMTDEDFYDAFNSSADNNTHEFLLKHNFSTESKKVVSEYQKSIRSGEKLNSAHWYPQFFADSIHDQQYFQLMKAYEEFNKPLRKEMRRNIIEHLNDVSPVLKEIREVKRSLPNCLKDDEVNEYIRSKISEIWGTVSDTPEYQVFVEKNLEIFEEHMEPSVVDEYKERFKTTLENVGQLMRPHFYVLTQAEYLDELQLSQTFKNKELFAPVKLAIKKCLDNSITNYSFSSQFLKQEFSKDTDNTTNILRCLYSQQDIRPIVDKWAENVVKASGVEDVTTYYEGFQSFLRGEPCEHENLFNYSKLTNYIRYYKDSYVEQAYSQIKKLVSTRKLKNHLSDIFQEDFPENPEQWIDLYQHIKNRPNNEDENAIKEYQNSREKLVSKLFQRVLHKDEAINSYISAVNKEFYRHSGNENIALTLENRFLTDMYSGDLFTVPNMQISYFAQRIPNEFLKNILKIDESKALLKPIYKDIKEAIYTELLSQEGNQVKESLLHLEELAKKLESCDYTNRPQLVAEVQNTVCDIIGEIETPELIDKFEKLREHLKLQVEETVPKEVQDDVTKLIDNMRSGVLYMPYNYIIFAMGAENKATYGKAVAWDMKEDIQNLNHLIYKNFYEIVSHSKPKREASPVYQLVKQLINAPLPSNPKEKFERKQLHTKILAEFRQNSDFEKTYQQLENTFYQKLHDCCKIDNVSKLYESTVIDGDFGSINSTIEFMASNTESVVARINRQKAIRCVKLICGAVAYSLYNETNHQIQRNLSQKNTLSRGMNKFITKKVNRQINQFLSH